MDFAPRYGKSMKSVAQYFAERRPTPAAPKALPSTEIAPPKPLSHGESGEYHPAHSRAVRDVSAELGRYKGLTIKGSLARFISEWTGNGAEIAAFQISVMRGTAVTQREDENGDVRTVEPSIKERQEAAKWLGDRLFGKVAQALVLEDKTEKPSAELDTSLLTDLELETLQTATKRQHERAAGSETPEPSVH